MRVLFVRFKNAMIPLTTTTSATAGAVEQNQAYTNSTQRLTADSSDYTADNMMSGEGGGGNYYYYENSSFLKSITKKRFWKNWNKTSVD